MIGAGLSCHFCHYLLKCTMSELEKIIQEFNHIVIVACAGLSCHFCHYLLDCSASELEKMI